MSEMSSGGKEINRTSERNHKKLICRALLSNKT